MPVLLKSAFPFSTSTMPAKKNPQLLNSLLSLCQRNITSCFSKLQNETFSYLWQSCRVHITHEGALSNLSLQGQRNCCKEYLWVQSNSTGREPLHPLQKLVWLFGTFRLNVSCGIRTFTTFIVSIQVEIRVNCPLFEVYKMAPHMSLEVTSSGSPRHCRPHISSLCLIHLSRHTYVTMRQFIQLPSNTKEHFQRFMHYQHCS